MKKKIISLIVIIVFLLSSCQSTPTNKVVIGKGKKDYFNMLIKAGLDAEMVEGDIVINDIVSNVYEETSINYDCSKKLDYIITRGNTTIEFDADVNIPEYQMPICIVKPNVIGYDMVNGLLNLMGNEKLYNYEFTSSIRTKKIIQGEIDNMMYAMQLINKDVTLIEEEIVDQEQFIQGEIEKLYKEMEIAPGSYEEAAKSIEFGKTVSAMGSIITEEMTKPVVIDEENYSLCNYRLVVGESVLQRFLNIAATDNKQTQQIFIMDLYRAIPDTNSIIDKELAEDIIEPYVNLLGSELHLVDSRLVDEDNIGDGYQFVYKRLFNGVESNYARGQSGGWRAEEDRENSDNSADVYKLTYEQECLLIQVDNKGYVYQMYYNSPVIVEEYLTHNAQLLPFEDIKKILDTYIGLNGFNPEDDVKITITEAKLGMMRIDIPDTTEQYLVVPVWDFYGYFEYSSIYEGKKIEILPDKNLAYQCFLTINAIDGSIIDRALGY